jgi:hypothetical protein
MRKLLMSAAIALGVMFAAPAPSAVAGPVDTVAPAVAQAAALQNIENIQYWRYRWRYRYWRPRYYRPWRYRYYRGY